MKKLKGIMIDGEWLGDNVVINGTFRAICNISPIIVLEFVKLVNKLESKNAQYAITSFNFSDSDGIHICFENSKFKGFADLSFVLKNSELFLKTSYLEIKPLNDLESNVESEPILQSKNTKKIEESLSIKEEASKEVTELIEVKQSIDKNEPLVEENNIVESEVVEKFEPNKIEVRPIEVEAKHPPMQVVKQQMSPISVIAQTPILEKDVLSTNNESIKDIKEVTNTVLQEATEIIKESLDEPFKIEEENLVKRTNMDDFSFLSLNDKDEKSEHIIDDSIEQFINIATIDKKESIEDFFVDLEESENEVVENNSKIFEEGSLVDSLQNNVFEDDSINDSEQSQVVEDVQLEFSLLNDELDDKEAEECLLDFYNAIKHADEQPKIELVQDDTILQAVLSEMMTLKDELDALKAEQTKRLTAKEFFGDIDSVSLVKDENADFKILSSTDKINAAILDEDCFIAGEKLYRWGETFYLED